MFVISTYIATDGRVGTQMDQFHNVVVNNVLENKGLGILLLAGDFTVLVKKCSASETCLGVLCASFAQRTGNAVIFLQF